MDDTFLYALAEIFRNLPNQPIAFLGVVCVLVSLISLIFFHREPWRIKLFVFILIFLGGGAVVFAADGFFNQIRVEPTSTSARTAADRASPRENLPFQSLPSNLEILVFDASSGKSQGLKLARCLKASNPTQTVDFQKEWLAQWEMDYTRIYYQRRENLALGGTNFKHYTRKTVCD